MAQIGEPQRVIIAEPIWSPVPEREPNPAAQPLEEPLTVEEPKEIPA